MLERLSSMVITADIIDLQVKSCPQFLVMDFAIIYLWLRRCG